MSPRLLLCDVDNAIRELRDGRGPTRTATVQLLNRCREAIAKTTCLCEKERCKYPLCHANKETVN